MQINNVEIPRAAWSRDYADMLLAIETHKDTGTHATLVAMIDATVKVAARAVGDAWAQVEPHVTVEGEDANFWGMLAALRGLKPTPETPCDTTAQTS